MADATLTLVPWGPGTPVGAYPRRSEQMLPEQPPTMIAAQETATVDDDASLTFTALADGEYWAIATDGSPTLTYVSFNVETPVQPIPGPPGPAGPAGPTGPQGTGLAVAPWSDQVQYHAGDLVAHNNRLWRAPVLIPMGRPPVLRFGVGVVANIPIEHALTLNQALIATITPDLAIWSAASYPARGFYVNVAAAVTVSMRAVRLDGGSDFQASLQEYDSNGTTFTAAHNNHTLDNPGPTTFTLDPGDRYLLYSVNLGATNPRHEYLGCRIQLTSGSLGPANWELV